MPPPPLPQCTDLPRLMTLPTHLTTPIAPCHTEPLSPCMLHDPHHLTSPSLHAISTVSLMPGLPTSPRCLFYRGIMHNTHTHAPVLTAHPGPLRFFLLCFRFCTFLFVEPPPPSGTPVTKPNIHRYHTHCYPCDKQTTSTLQHLLPSSLVPPHLHHTQLKHPHCQALPYRLCTLRPNVDQT